MTSDSYEEKRESFRPTKVNVLFVGESRPANGTFFYQGDSNLAKYTCEAFSQAGKPVLERIEFLQQFKAKGCFLVDLCPQPVNQLPHAERREARRQGEAALAETLAELRPRAIVVVMTGIAGNIRRSVRQARQQELPLHVLPFPAMGHQHAYVEGLRHVLAELRDAGVLGQ